MSVNRVWFGDCRESMRQMLAAGTRVQMCVTSPPYFGLRDYGHPGQIGLEPSPDEYVAALVETFGLVRDLLADDGTLWLNLGDSYNAHPGQRKTTDKAGEKQQSVRGSQAAPSRCVSGIKPKDLIGIPWRVAFALQADGWYLRQDIIWHKPNPMPESVTDRCTKAHEYLFLLSKSAKYYFDANAISEPAIYAGRVVVYDGTQKNCDKKDDPLFATRITSNRSVGDMRNRRSVWTIPTAPYDGAHFAVFPPALIEPCIMAGSRPGDVVLDPFFGSGTTGQVCESLGRRWIGCELNDDYAPLQKSRTAQIGMVL